MRELASARQAAGLSMGASRTAGSSSTRGHDAVYVDGSVEFQLATVMAEILASRNAPPPSQMASMASGKLLRSVYSLVVKECAGILDELESGAARRPPSVSALAAILSSGSGKSVRASLGGGAAPTAAGGDEHIPVVEL